MEGTKNHLESPRQQCTAASSFQSPIHFQGRLGGRKKPDAARGAALHLDWPMGEKALSLHLRTCSSFQESGCAIFSLGLQVKSVCRGLSGGRQVRRAERSCRTSRMAWRQLQASASAAVWTSPAQHHRGPLDTPCEALLSSLNPTCPWCQALGKAEHLCPETRDLRDSGENGAVCN